MNRLGKFNCASGVVNILYNKDGVIIRTSTIKDMLLVDRLLTAMAAIEQHDKEQS